MIRIVVCQTNATNTAATANSGPVCVHCVQRRRYTASESMWVIDITILWVWQLWHLCLDVEQHFFTLLITTHTTVRIELVERKEFRKNYCNAKKNIHEKLSLKGTRTARALQQFDAQKRVVLIIQCSLWYFLSLSFCFFFLAFWFLWTR